MEKLIELLNEREKTVNWVQYPWWCKEHLEYQCHWPRVINKRFWFIEWLVENDKIDLDKCWLDVRHYLSYNKRYDKWIVMAENYDNDTFVVREFYSPYEQLLMLLSISDTPIEDLISYLK